MLPLQPALSPVPHPQQALRKSGQNLSAPQRSLQSTGVGTGLGRFAPFINRPGITLTPWPRPLLPLLLSFNSRSLTNPSFQAREADLFWGRAVGAARSATTSGCHSQETMGLERQGERGRVLRAEFPCLIRSCGWHRVSKGKEPNSLGGFGRPHPCQRARS